MNVNSYTTMVSRCLVGTNVHALALFNANSVKSGFPAISVAEATVPFAAIESLTTTVPRMRAL